MTIAADLADSPSIPKTPSEIHDAADSFSNDDARWRAVMARDRAADDRFVTGVISTGIYCRPSCAARHPHRENVRFFADGAAAQKAGLRPCRRCRPDDASRDQVAVAKAAALLAGGAPMALEVLAAEVGYAPHHFHRLFKRATGVTPAAYARGVRAARATEALDARDRVTGAVYAAGYGAPSRFYEGAGPRLGMAPATRRKGGAGEVIRWTVASTSLGPLLIAATDKGLCRVAFDEDEAALAERFPNAEVRPGDAALARLATDVVAAVETPALDHALPLDLRGTAFQERVWQALRTIPAGETRSYAELAAIAGNLKATRAAGSACGANPVAVVVPCHRARRADGGAGGYAWGLARKDALLTRERG